MAGTIQALALHQTRIIWRISTTIHSIQLVFMQVLEDILIVNTL